MIISKFSRLAKKKGSCQWVNLNGDGAVLITGRAAYHAPLLPRISNLEYPEEDQRIDAIFGILDIDTDLKGKKFNAYEMSAPGRVDVLGYNLAEFDEDEDEADIAKMLVLSEENEIYTPIITHRGDGIFFIKTDYLEPIKDTMENPKHSGYVTTSIRRHIDSRGNARPYVVIKNGMIPIAAIEPSRIITKKWLEEMQDFLFICRDQYDKEKAMESDTGRADGDAGQMNISDL